MKRLLLVRYGEIGLKGGNRHLFEEQLMDNMRHALGDDIAARVRREYGRVFVELDDGDQMEDALERLSRVFGIVALNPALQVPLQLENIQEAAVALATPGAEMARTFRVTARRPNKRFPMTSQQVNEAVGGALLRSVPGLSVRLKQPDMTVFVELRDKAAYVYVDQVDGPGGLPVGASSKALLLLSGGIDSPVAGWMALKRGIALEAIHFHSPPFTSERAKQKAVDLAEALASWGRPVPLHVVHFTEIQTALHDAVPESLGMTVMRRFMVRIATEWARRRGAPALVTGESVGQVASQTLESMAAINAVTTTPILRPLVGFDKHEIMARAEQIGTYDISIRPYDDCCTLFVPERPATKPSIHETEAAERKLDVDGLVNSALQSIETVVVGGAEAPVLL